MARVTDLFARLGLFTQVADTSDAFALRLTRIGTRERRCACQSAGLFRTQ